VSKDIGENNDISKELPEITKKMLKQLNDWKQEINAVIRPAQLNDPKKSKKKNRKNKNNK